MNPIPFLDLTRQYKTIEEEVMSATKEVFRKASLSGGYFVERFEKEFAGFCGAQYGSGVNSGTSALHLSLLALGIKKGDEVIIPANTFIATAWAVSYVGATPVFVDCTADTWEINTEKIEDRINPRTKAIIGVHLFGQPFDIDKVKEIALANNLFFIEDCAQAHGAIYKGKTIGSFGEMGCFSFYPSKNLGAMGEGGAIVSNNENYIKHINKLKNHGSEQRYYHDELGYNMRMEGLQGAVLSVKLKYLNEWNSQRKNIAKRYKQQIFNERIKFQKIIPDVESVYHLFVISCKERDKLNKYLHDKNISTGFHYPVPCHLQKAYKYLGYKTGSNPNAEYLAENSLSLPMFPELKDEEVDYVIEVLNNFQ